ncbi:toll-like receptor 22 [Polymixia lowei]
MVILWDVQLAECRNKLSIFRSWELSNTSTRLAALDLSQNPIKVFNITTDMFPSLTRLNLGRCGTGRGIVWDVRNETFLGRVSSLDISGLHLSFDAMKTFLESLNSSLTSLRLNAMRSDLQALINVSCKIPSLTTLKLQRNKLKDVTSNTLRLCSTVTELDLSDNLIKHLSDDSFKSLQRLRILSLKRNCLSSVPGAIRSRPTLGELDLSFNKISAVGCKDFAGLTRLQHLHLCTNPLTALGPCVFKDLRKLQYLKLQNNTMTNLNGAFKENLPNLKILDLFDNKLTAINREEFKGLQSLQNLSLEKNQITRLERGAFIGLTNLTTIHLGSNQLDSTQLNQRVFSDLKNVRRLLLMDNHIQYKSDKVLTSPPFTHLSSLETLLFNGQHRRLKSHIPRNFLQGLTNLSEFSARNMQLTSFHVQTFNYTPNLRKLDISSNELAHIPASLFSPLRNLKSLYISRTNLRSLDFILQSNLTEVEYLQVRKNSFSVINETVMESLPSLNYLDMQGNSFTCDCDNAGFLQWVETNRQTQVFDAYNFECNYPSVLTGMRLLDLDVHSCSVDVGFVCLVSTACAVLLVQMVAFTYHLLRWQLVYAYYLLLGFLFNTKRRNVGASYQYDAFISYNVHDELWVLSELLPKLEDEQGWRLCLHHRDFQPGKPIIDNITDAIYGSRKTICVISRRYLESEWCSREIQVASFRLFDEQKDVLILVFLEDIPTAQLSPYYRMRKLLKRRTYLSWPRADQHTELFWEKVRQAMGTKEGPAGDALHLNLMEG